MNFRREKKCVIKKAALCPDSQFEFVSNEDSEENPACDSHNLRFAFQANASLPLGQNLLRSGLCGKDSSAALADAFAVKWHMFN